MRKQTYVGFVMFVALILSGRGLLAQGFMSCTGVSWGPRNFGSCSLLSLCQPGTCIPWTDSCTEVDQNSCQGTPPYPTQTCSATITKSNHYMAGFPDGAIIGTSPFDWVSNGVALTASSCTDNGVGWPYSYGECWPIFDDPSFLDGVFSAIAQNRDANLFWQTCAVGGPPEQGGLIVPYIAGFWCTPGSILSVVNAQHQCCAGLCCDEQAVQECISALGEWDWANCTCIRYDPTPIVMDVTGDGYELTDLTHGVSFNLTGRGPQRISWTNPQHGNAWLALDRNANGVIDEPVAPVFDLRFHSSTSRIAPA